MSDHLDAERMHRNSVERYLRDEGKKVAEEQRRLKAGGKPMPIPDPEYRRAHIISDTVQSAALRKELR